MISSRRIEAWKNALLAQVCEQEIATIRTNLFKEKRLPTDGEKRNLKDIRWRLTHYRNEQKRHLSTSLICGDAVRIN